MEFCFLKLKSTGAIKINLARTGKISWGGGGGYFNLIYFDHIEGSF